ncbi:hypothetical protein V8C35DRAFT_300083 [Trichoderma chlorosporum]
MFMLYWRFFLSFSFSLLLCGSFVVTCLLIGFLLTCSEKKSGVRGVLLVFLVFLYSLFGPRYLFALVFDIQVRLIPRCITVRRL